VSFSELVHRPISTAHMHCCLLIPEIVGFLCAELGCQDAKRSLAVFARTCLAISEPALDILRYELHDLLPLVQCMPCDLWKLESGMELVLSFSSIYCTVADAIYRSFGGQLYQQTGKDSSIMQGVYASLPIVAVALKHGMFFKH
jgi:hypothetical protein